MKKLLLITALLLFAGIAFGQNLQKGSILSIHVMTITLDPDVTMNQFLDFYTNKWVAEVEKHTEGMKGVLLKGDRGENPNSIAYLWIIDSPEAREKYWPEADKPTEEWTAVMEKARPVSTELLKLGTWSEIYTDWVIQ